MKDDPYNDIKIYHKANKRSQTGGVSALCFKTPRSINMNRATWTFRDEAVTCKKCLKKIRREKFEFIKRVYLRLDRMAGESYGKDNDLMWWYIDGRDFFYDLHFT